MMLHYDPTSTLGQGMELLEKNGRHVGTRTPDLYRVNFEVNSVKPFSHLAFPHLPAAQSSPKRPSFDGELMASLRTCSAPLGTIPDCWRHYAINNPWNAET